VPATKVRVHDPSIRRAASASPTRGARGMLAAALRALRGWWVAQRRYRPERRYMGGGRPRGAPELARR